MCIGWVSLTQKAFAQDSLPPKKSETPPTTQLPPATPEAVKSEKATVPNLPPSTPATEVFLPPSTPYTTTGTLDNYPPTSGGGYTHYRSITDTVKPYIADPYPLQIVPWNTPDSNEPTNSRDSMLFSVRPNLNVTPKENVMVSLDTWKEETRVFSVPFQLDGVSELRLSRFFYLPDTVRAKENLFIYFEGVAWRTELKLNGKFLGINNHPLKPWIVPLRREWLSKEENLLELSLSQKESATFFPKKFLGIFRPVYILTEKQLNEVTKPVMPSVASTTSPVAIVMPFYQDHRYIFDKFQAVRTLVHAQKNGIDKLFFLLPPDRELKKLCAEMGFIQVLQLKPAQKVCWLNDYPYEPINFPYPESFWLDKKGLRTPNYGTFTTFGIGSSNTNSSPVTILYVFLIIFPLIGVFVMKLLNPKLFSTLPDILLKPRLQIERFIEAVAGNQGLSYFLQALRVLMIAITLALFIDYIHRNNQWHLTGLAGENALIKIFFAEKSIFLNYLLKSIILASVWAILRWFLIRTLSNLFNIYNMYDGLTNLELVASYPLILIINLPLVFMSFLPEGGQTTMIILQGVFLSLYLLRQMYVCFVGMGRLFKFSTSVKIIYISLSVCLPYLITL